MGTKDLEFSQQLVEHSPAMLWRAEPNGQRTYFNAAWLSFTGRGRDLEAGEGWLLSVHPEDVKACQARYLDHLQRCEPFQLEYRLRRADGVYRTVLDRVAPSIASGELTGFFGSCMDVDDLRAREVSSGAHDFFEMSLDCLGIAGFDGYLRYVNPSWTRTLGWTAQELLSRPSVEFVHPDDREATLAARQRLKEGVPLTQLVNRYLCKDGTYRWFEWRSIAHADRGVVYAAARDISEQKWAEERLAQAKEQQELLQRQLVFADRMASIGTLAAGVAHEINNPLAFVAANISMLVNGLESLSGEHPSSRTAELKGMAAEIEVGAERIRKIVSGLMTFSRGGKERLGVVDVHQMLELAIDMTSNKIRDRARLVREYGEIPRVEADEARLAQVFVNLLVNAAQAIPEGNADAHEIRVVTSTDAEGHAVIEVRDTGVGIPKHLIERIFDPFFTTKPVGVGTGLGLSISHTILEGLGGEIAVASTGEHGTTLRVVLPAAAHVQSAADHVQPAPSRRAGLTG
jgi:PAS domain S-box-containing protein